MGWRSQQAWRNGLMRLTVVTGKVPLMIPVGVLRPLKAAITLDYEQGDAAHSVRQASGRHAAFCRAATRRLRCWTMRQGAGNRQRWIIRLWCKLVERMQQATWIG